MAVDWIQLADLEESGEGAIVNTGLIKRVEFLV